MDELNNKQMILLTMLTSFVVSVGTGVMTVAMLEEAPPTLTQTVNRVVERTIERVVTGSSTPESSAVKPVTTITKEVTIYAKEDDFIVAAVEKNQPRIALIFSAGQATGTIPFATGFVVSRDGVIVADHKSISVESALLPSYRVTIGSRSYVAVPMKHDAIGKTPLAMLKISETLPADIFDAVTFGRQADAKIAQTIIALGGVDGGEVFKGTLSKFSYTKSESTTTPDHVTSMNTNPRIPDDYAGALVVNLDAQAVGIVVNPLMGTDLVIYPASRILELITAVSSGATQSASASGAPKDSESAS